jgi:protein TonB
MAKASRIEADNVVLFPERTAAALHAVPVVAPGERPTRSPVQRWSRIALLASLALHTGLFLAFAWRFTDDLARAAGAAEGAATEGAIIPVEVLIEAALPPAPTPTNATLAVTNEVTPEPVQPQPPQPAPVVIVPNEAPTPALPVEANAKPAEVETRDTPQAPARVVQEPRKLEPKPVKKRQAAASAAASPSRAAAARGEGRAGAGGQGEIGGSANRSSYQALVLAHLQRHRIYPETARSRGITGVAAVRFALAPDGSVMAAGLAHSSGQAVLDTAVTDMVRRASPFPPAPPGLNPGRLDFAASIRFDLR